MSSEWISFGKNRLPRGLKVYRGDELCCKKTGPNFVDYWLIENLILLTPGLSIMF